MTGPGWGSLAVVVLALGAGPGVGGAQAQGTAQAQEQTRGQGAAHAQAHAHARADAQGMGAVGIVVAAHHWTYDLLDRLAGAGMVEGAWLPGHRPTTAEAILRALAVAEEAADGEWAAAARSAREWLVAEYGTGEAGWGVAPAVALRGGDGAGTEGAAVAFVPEAFWAPVPGLAFFVTPELTHGESEGWGGRLVRGGVAGRVGNVRLTASRDNVRYGRGAQGGIVLGDASVLDGVEVGLVEPLRPSGFLRWLGALDGSVHLGRIGADEYGETAAFLAGELRLRPHPRVQVGVHRSALVVGTSAEGEAIGLRDIVYLGIGKHSDFEDQRLGLTASFRATIGGVDLVPYAELGLEDSAGLDEDPGVVVGVHVPALPALPGVPMPVGLRYEYVAFGMDGRFWIPDQDVAHWQRWLKRNWYRHSFVRDQYRDAQGNVLGHPLGGYGHQHLLEVEAPLVIPGTVLKAGAYSREREDEAAWANLLADTFPGVSRGGYLEALSRRGRIEVAMGLDGEVGREGWRRVEGRIQVRYLTGW